MIFSLLKNIKSDISVVKNIIFWMTSAFSISLFCFTSHYPKRYISNGMIHIQRPSREFARAFTKFWLVESWILDTWSNGSRYRVRWKAIVRWPSAVSAAAGPCIQKTKFQSIRICLPHAHVTYLANVTYFCTRRHAHWVYCNEPRHDKTNKMSVRPAKTQISLGIRPVWSESSLSAWRKLDWSESSLGAQSLCWICHVAALILFYLFIYLLIYLWHFIK